MKLVCDEGVERQIVDQLRSGGHDVIYVAEWKPGSTDDEVLDPANRQDSLLITPDKDFRRAGIPPRPDHRWGAAASPRRPDE